MISFYTIPTFRNSIHSLCSKRKDGYTSVQVDIANVFTNATMEEIRINRDMVFQNEKLTIVKLRIQNSGQKLSKKDGFRLIYIAFHDEDKVVFLNIYPKRGPKGLVTVSSNEILSYLREYLQVSDTDLLVRYDF